MSFFTLINIMSIIYLPKERNEHLLHPVTAQFPGEREYVAFYNRQESLEQLPSSDVHLMATPLLQDLEIKSQLQLRSLSTVSQISTRDDYKLVRAMDMHGIYDPNWGFAWSWIVGLVGLCDFLCWLLSSLFPNENVPIPHKSKWDKFIEFILFWKRHRYTTQLNLNQPHPQQYGLPFHLIQRLVIKQMSYFILWFTSRHVTFTRLFSTVWVFEGFLMALKTHRRMKSEYMLGMTLMRRDGKLMSTTLFDMELHLPLIAATLTFVVYLSLVPVEFFLMNWNDVQPMLSLRANVQPYFHATSFHYCILYVVYLDITSGFVRTLAEAKAAYLFALYRKLTVQTVNLAVRDPPSLKKRAYFLLRFMRWAKYLAPLIGTANMLLDSAMDLMRKWKQFHDARIAQKVVNQYWKIMTVHGRQARAAIVIQRKYRSYHSTLLREKYRSESIKKVAAQRIQRAMRHQLKRTRKRLDTNVERLEKAKALKDKNAPIEHWIQLKELKDDLKSTCDAKISRRILLRPNTKFSVTWKVLFVISVSIEISFLSLKPYIERTFLSQTHDPITIESAVATMVIPDPFYFSPRCNYRTGEARKYVTKKKKKKLPIIPEKEPLSPWYCHEPWLFLQVAYIRSMSLLIHETDKLISTICFLDVFITLFTGEIDEATGVLKPKSFFTRWVFPGLVLQFLVNPKMVDVALSIKRLSVSVYRIGPSRVLRWSVAFILPVYTHLTSWALWNIWMRFVSWQNLNHVWSRIKSVN